MYMKLSGAVAIFSAGGGGGGGNFFYFTAQRSGAIASNAQVV